MHNISFISYFISSICFIMALRGLSSAATAKSGNMFGIAGMALAILTTVFNPNVSNYFIICLVIAAGGGVGAFIARRISMTALPQLVAGFHSLVGLAAVLVAGAAFLAPDSFGITNNGSIKAVSLLEMGLGLAVGALTFTGSIVAFAKLQGLLSGKPINFPLQHPINLGLAGAILALIALLMVVPSSLVFLSITILSLAFGVLLIIPIGGADMPVVISMLNSYSGWAAAGIGFTLNNYLLMITGALVGASGAILSYIMCKGMNRSFIGVIMGGMGNDTTSHTESTAQPVKASSPEDAAFILQNSRNVIIVPGYGMAVAQAQHSLKEVENLLSKNDVNVRYAIHPVAGRMPGHMNVLLAEANVEYDKVLELEDINHDFGTTDVAIVIGANDITNPSAKTDSSSPLYGMPVLDVAKAKTVFFIKRSMGSGYSGVDNPLFYKDNTYMLFGDAKKVCDEIIKHL